MTPARLCGGFSIVLLVLATAGLQQVAPGGWAAALLTLDGDSFRQIAVLYSWLPRLVIALLSGAGLALAGVLLQQTLRNPLASPTTLGIATGGQLGLLLATLFAPALLLVGRGTIAFLGGAVAMGLVFALSWRRALAPAVVVLAGLVVNLYLGALTVVFILFNQEQLKGLMIWGAGSLAQNNWAGVIGLAPRLVIGMVAAAALARTLSVLELDDVNARSLGVSLKYLRAAAIGLGVFLTAIVVSGVGVISFVGLAAPAVVRLAGARTLAARLLWAPLFGALLLAITDLGIQLLVQDSATLIPTGAATAILGAPLLIWLLPRVTLTRSAPSASSIGLVARHAAPGRLIGLLLGLTAAMVVVALFVGRGADGWTWPLLDAWQATGAWRVPRVLASGAAGVMLALAGTIIQRVSGNPMGSPEFLGISSGTGLGLIALALLWPAAGTLALLGAGTLGALAALAVLIVVNMRNDFEPERVLLTGIAMMFLFDAVQRIVLAGGDPRTQKLLAWISGSTYYVSMNMAIGVAVLALVLAALTRPLAAWLDVLPLGMPTARALGLDVMRSRLLLLLLVSFLTAGATLVVGPLSFVGLIAPHMARLLGLSRARDHMAGSMALGALLMIGADWAGRQLLFPSEIPAGLAASLLGGAYFMWRLRRI
ncbi:Fe(3+)-hydroxamate ABC transporter permease FhuB [Salinisphaera aquimarina]|uniref:Fe(3+)-hydroxamate ABC transporter permease FhuB n=1 Tax=Salinisphaera aquimarina TaxID=2094031 RepID=A0ABV7EN40_9GAMM